MLSVVVIVVLRTLFSAEELITELNLRGLSGELRRGVDGAAVGGGATSPRYDVMADHIVRNVLAAVLRCG